jgi:hypothetical protein
MWRVNGLETRWACTIVEGACVPRHHFAEKCGGVEGKKFWLRAALRMTMTAHSIVSHVAVLCSLSGNGAELDNYHSTEKSPIIIRSCVPLT